MVAMDKLMQKASQIRHDYKPAPGHDPGAGYIFGQGARDQMGTATLKLMGKRGIKKDARVLLVYDSCSTSVEDPGSGLSLLGFAQHNLEDAGLEISAEVVGAGANSPIVDGYRILGALQAINPDVILAYGGTSVLDSVSYSNALYIAQRAGQKDDPNRFWGVGRVTELAESLKGQSLYLLPVVKVQFLAGATGHLTKYSNNTNTTISPSQKSLIIDDANRADLAIFDPELTLSAPMKVRLDGGYDILAHLFEPLVHADPNDPDKYRKVEYVAVVGASIFLNSVKGMVDKPSDLEIATQVATAADMGGIMIDQLQGTGLPHLASFLFVDNLAHGSACAITLPSYVAAFARRSPDAVRAIGRLYQQVGIGTDVDLADIKGKKLGVAVGNMMMELAEQTNYPTSLSQVDGFGEENLELVIEASTMEKYATKLQGVGLETGTQEAREAIGKWITAAFNGNLETVPQFNPR